MEKKDRVKYYPIGLKDKKLHDEFMMRKLELGSKNVDDALEWLLNQISLRIDTRYRLESMKKPNENWDEAVNRLLNEIDASRKEDELLKEIKELLFGPLRHIVESTEEEVDQLEITNEFHKEFDERLKRFWKRLANKKTLVRNQVELD